MALKLGGTSISKGYLGATEITKAYLGATLVLGSSYDADAQAYIDAVLAESGTLTDTIKDKINYWFVTAKAEGWFADLYVAYLMRGGNAGSHQLNALNPVNTDAAYRGTIVGGWTHSTAGAQGNGTNGNINTHLIPANDMVENDTSWGYFCGNNIADTSPAIGLINTTSNKPIISLYPRFIDNNAYADAYSLNSGRIATGNTDSKAFFIDTRTSASVHKLFKNGVQLGSTNTGAALDASTTWANLDGPLTLNGFYDMKNDSYLGASAHLCQSSFAGKGLTDAKVLQINAAFATLNSDR